jgi:hypothetical protein
MYYLFYFFTNLDVFLLLINNIMINNKKEQFTYSTVNADVAADDLNQQYIYDNQILVFGIVAIVSLITGSFLLSV